MANGAIVVGGYVNGLGIARALAAQGHSVAVITTKPYDIAQHSRWVNEHQHLSDLEYRPESLVELLEHCSRKWSGRVVFPTNDEALASLSKYSDRLSRWYRLVVPPPEATPYLLEKDQMLRAAEETGVPVPRCYGPATDTIALQPDLTYPVVVKPVKGYRFSARFGSKLFVAKDRSELLACARRLAEVGLTGLILDVVPGRDSHLYSYCVYMDKRANPSAGLTVRKLRQTPMFFGVARVAELVEDNNALREPTVEILRRIGFRGIASAEFKFDLRDGTYRFLEVNGRSVKYNTLLQRGGMDLVHLAWSDYVDGQVSCIKPRSWRGVWIHLHADLLHSMLSWRQEQLGTADYLAPYRRRKTFAVWSSHDPVPFMAEWSQTVRKAASAVFSRSCLTCV